MKNDFWMAATCITPHPPLIVEDIGGSERRRVQATVEAMEKLSTAIAELNPDVMVMVSPHSPSFESYFTVKKGSILKGNFGNFGVPRVGSVKRNDEELVEALLEEASLDGCPLRVFEGNRGRWGDEEDLLDHGLLVPLHFLDKRLDSPIVSLSISWLDYKEHFRLGELVRRSCENLKRRAVFVASGDLSHRLIPGAPAGYSPRGKDFDQQIKAIAQSGKFEELASLDENLVYEAGECGLRSFYTMWGVLKGLEAEHEVLSYEGPFGVGYLVSLHRVLGVVS